jgi:hypothetical protein
MFGEPEARLRFHGHVLEEFRVRGLSPRRISGNWGGRTAAAVAAIEARL